MLHSLFFLCPFSHYAEKQKSLNVSGVILPPRVIVGQKGRVTVSIEGRRVDRVQTAWFLNNTPISDTSLNGRSKIFFFFNFSNYIVISNHNHRTPFLLCFVKS